MYIILNFYTRKLGNVCYALENSLTFAQRTYSYFNFVIVLSNILINMFLGVVGEEELEKLGICWHDTCASDNAFLSPWTTDCYVYTSILSSQGTRQSDECVNISFIKHLQNPSTDQPSYRI